MAAKKSSDEAATAAELEAARLSVKMETKMFRENISSGKRLFNIFIIIFLRCRNNKGWRLAVGSLGNSKVIKC